MKNKILSITLAITALAILALSLTQPLKAHAQYYNEANQSNMISVDKKVRSIDNDYYSDNIESSKRVFHEGEIIEFSITVENIGKDNLKNIQVIDTLPTNLSLIFYPGTFDKTNNKVSWTVDSLNPAEVKKYLVRAKIVDTQLLTANIVQMTNVADVKGDNVSARDQSIYFIGKAQIPRTGNTALPIQTALVVIVGASGIFLRRFVRGY